MRCRGPERTQQSVRVGSALDHSVGLQGAGLRELADGFFVDDLERRPDGWRIVYRRLEILWMDTFPTT